MGIPFYFKYLCKKYPKCIIDLPFFQQTYSINQLYFDLNGQIHPSCFKARKKNLNDIEKNIFSELNKDIDNIINLVKPTDLVYLGVDGVAPFAKMNQQRSRRYKSLINNIKISTINKKYDVKIADWDTNMISPGTPFMDKLMDYLKVLEKNLNKSNSYQTILSTSNEPGEGEHKIVKVIRDYNNNDDVKVIFGLDADLIMLGLISDIENIYLLRESKVFGNDKHEYLVLDINELRNAIYMEVQEYYKKINSVFSFSRSSIIKDYIVLCFMVGNDFLPNIVMLNIDKGAINYLLKVYTKNLYKYNKNLVNGDLINWDILVEIIDDMSKDEDSFLKTMHNNYYKKKYYEPSHLSPYECELRQLDYLPLLSNIQNNIEYNKNNWEKRYYVRYLKSDQFRASDIDNMCHQYLEGLQWVLYYYLGDCPSWSWYFMYQSSPLVVDILKYLKNNKINISFIKNSPMTPEKQLLCILPRKSLEKIDKLKNVLDRLDYLYPNKFQIDMLYKIYHHECKIYLPKINFNTIYNMEIKN